MIATADHAPVTTLRDTASALIARKRLIAFAVPTMILAYFIYLFFAFDIPGVAERARLDNARVLVADSYSYKTHVTHDNRNDGLTVAIKGENKGTYADGMLPDFVTPLDGDAVRVTLGAGEEAEMDGPNLRYSVPDYGTVTVTVEGPPSTLATPDGGVPDWISATKARVRHSDAFWHGCNRQFH